MKNVTKILFVVCASLWALTFSQEAKAAAIPSPSYSVQNLATQLATPEEIARFIFRHFSVESDQKQFGKEEFWQTPEELLSNGKGDCEDFAFFANSVLKANGVSSFLVNVYGKKFAHTLCVFQENGSFHVIDGDEVKRYEAKSLEELFSLIYHHWESAQLVTYSSAHKNGRVLKTFRK